MKYLFFALFFVGIIISCYAQERRALIIGIDKYTPPAGKLADGAGRSSFGDLDGCKNDAKSVEALIESSRFGFEPEQIKMLYDTQASRQRILSELNQLLQQSKKGDYAFFYYAGHGSQQVNSLSKEEDKKDETIVPADSWKKGVADIRDKEQASIYNKFIDKGVKLTVILDCCHSGSMSRGEPEYYRPKSRFTPLNEIDAKDPNNPPAPESRSEDGFLMLSASQDYQPAQEQYDEENHIPHGAFTLALTQVLNQQPVNTSVENIIASIRAILKSNGKSQEPVVAGSNKRRQMNLLGMAPGLLTDKMLVPVQKVGAQTIELTGGIAIGLRKNNELTLVKGTALDTSFVLVVDSVISVNKSLAHVKRGSAAAIKAGQLFEITNWVGDGTALLKIYIPKNPFTYNEILKIAADVHNLQKNSKNKWILSLSKNSAYAGYWYKDGKLFGTVNGATQAGLSLKSMTDLEKTKKDTTIFFNLPVPVELMASIKEMLTKNFSIEITDDPSAAQYDVSGSIDKDGKPEYYLRIMSSNVTDSLESLPQETDRFVLNDGTTQSLQAVAGNLYDYAFRLARIRGWQKVNTPGTGNFPYRLIVKNSRGEEVNANGLRLGDTAKIYLVGTPDLTQKQASLKKSYAYVFVIDHSGAMQLAYGDGQNNQFPKKEDNGSLKKETELLAYEVAVPVGTDNFYLITSENPIDNAAAIFNQEAVFRTRSKDLPGQLDALLNAGKEGSGTRGFGGTISGGWALLKLGVKSTH